MELQNTTFLNAVNYCISNIFESIDDAPIPWNEQVNAIKDYVKEYCQLNEIPMPTSHVDLVGMCVKILEDEESEEDTGDEGTGDDGGNTDDGGTDDGSGTEDPEETPTPDPDEGGDSSGTNDPDEGESGTPDTDDEGSNEVEEEIY